MTHAQDAANPAKLNHLIYASAAAPGVDAAAVKTILRAARINNGQKAVTGMLLYTAGSFFQVLEGDESTLSALFTIISADPRHTNVTTIIQEPIAQRSFSDWTMGYSLVDQAELEEVEGFSDFFQDGYSFTILKAGRAKKLLAAFGDGRWRSRVDTGAK